MTNSEIEQKAAAVFQRYVRSGNSHKQLSNIIQADGMKFKEVPSKNAAFVGALTCGNNGQRYIMGRVSVANLGETAQALKTISETLREIAERGRWTK